MAKGKKGLGIVGFFGIIIAALAGIFAILVCIMMFSPGTKIAGFVFGSESTEGAVYVRFDDGVAKTQSDYNAEGGAPSTAIQITDISQIQKIVVDAKNHDVSIRQKDGQPALEVTRSTHFWGVYKQNSAPKFLDPKVTFDAGVLTVSIENPKGAVFKNNGLFVIDLPDSGNRLAYSNIEVEVKTQKGDIHFGGEKDETGDVLNSFKLKNVSALSEKGNISFNELFAPVGTSLSLNSQKGDINTDSISIPSADVVIETKKGHINIADGEGESVSALSLKIINEKGILVFGNILCDLDYVGDSGRLTAGTTKSIKCSDTTIRTNFVVDKIDGQFLLKHGKYSDITIGQITGKVDIGGENSKINISKASSDVLISQKRGKIHLSECSDMIQISSNRSKIDITDNTAAFEIFGKRSKINISIISVAEHDNVIKSEKGKAYVSFKQDADLKLVLKSDINSRIQFASYDEVTKEGTYYFNGANESTQKVVTIETIRAIAVSTLQG